MQLKISGM